MQLAHTHNATLATHQTANVLKIVNAVAKHKTKKNVNVLVKKVNAIVTKTALAKKTKNSCFSTLINAAENVTALQLANANLS